MRELALSVGDNFASGVHSLTLSWPALVAQLSSYVDTGETLEQYAALSKDEQLRVKDRGWWNGCSYSGARRDAATIQSLDVLTFDLDTCTPATPATVREFFSTYRYAGFMGSTHKHTPAAPRLRLALPLARSVTVDESDAIKRMIASQLGMRLFDPVSFRANQIMFWPSRCRDGAVLAETFGGNFLSPDLFLIVNYHDWTDRAEWPLHENEAKSATNKHTGKRADPRDRDDLIGAFCRLYTIENVIDEFIPGVYEPGTMVDRYTHTGGSTANGAALYEHGLYLYSHHQTDPANGLLCNAWDLVRIHKFGAADHGAKPGTDTFKLPSHAAMCEWAKSLDAVAEQLAKDALGLGDYFDPVDAPSAPHLTNKELFAKLALDKNGKVRATYENLLLFVRDHPVFAGSLAFNHNLGAPVWRRRMPWHDKFAVLGRSDETEGFQFADEVDELEIRDFFVRQYKGAELPAIVAIRGVCILIAQRNGFHPIREAFDMLPAWDGVQRLDDVLPRYLGCESTLYTRTIGRKFFCAVVARALQPGVKFDHMLLFIGPEGRRKSTLCSIIAGNPSWFKEGLPPIARMPDVVSAIKSKLICEWSDLHGMASSEIESIKAFITTQRDEVRLAYGKRTGLFLRQAVLVGTSNDDTPLRGRTGNRRMWPVHVRVEKIDVEAFAAERDQILAEAKAALAAGEALYLEADASEAARDAQEAARDIDPFEIAIVEWLNGSAPSRAYPGDDAGYFASTPKMQSHDVASIAQIACEALGFSSTGLGWPPHLRHLIREVMNAHPLFEKVSHTRHLPGYGSSRVWVRKVDSVSKASALDNVIPLLRAEHKKSALFDI